MLKTLNQAVDCVDENIQQAIDWSRWCKQMLIDEYHFKTIFFHLTKTTINDYVRKRRLSFANNDLVNGISVTEVAFKYLYQSVDSFTRALKKEFGYLPLQATRYQSLHLYFRLKY